VLQHRGNEGALEVGTGRKRPSIEHYSVHVPHDIPAGLFRRLEGIEDIATHGRDGSGVSSSESISSPQRNKLYELQVARRSTAAARGQAAC